jgi:hypothetical protein
MHITGKVSNIETKSVTFRKGPQAGRTGVAYTLVVDGKQISAGFKKPTYGVGDIFSGEISDSPDRWGVFQMVRTPGYPVPPAAIMPISATPEATVSRPTYTPSSPSYAGKAFPIPKSDHATSICRQSALKAAVDYHVAMVNNGFLTQSEMTPEAILTVASDFAKWTTGQAEVEEANRILSEGQHEVAG